MKKFLPLLVLSLLIFSGCLFELGDMFNGQQEEIPKDVEVKEDEDIYYIEEDPVDCETIRFQCKEGFVPFSDETGCGCVKSVRAELTIEEEKDNYSIYIEYPDFVTDPDAKAEMMKILENEIQTFKYDVDVLGLTKEVMEEFGAGKSTLYIVYDVYLLNDDIISFSFRASSYMSGAAHPFSYTIPFNYDLEEGKIINTTDLFVPDTNYGEILSYIAVPVLKEKLYVDDSWIEDGAGPEPENFQNFNITENGLIFHFDPYIVAPYAAGPQTVEISFDEIYAVLQPKWTD